MPVQLAASLRRRVWVVEVLRARSLMWKQRITPQSGRRTNRPDRGQRHRALAEAARGSCRREGSRSLVPVATCRRGRAARDRPTLQIVAHLGAAAVSNTLLFSVDHHRAARKSSGGCGTNPFAILRLGKIDRAFFGALFTYACLEGPSLRSSGFAEVAAHCQSLGAGLLDVGHGEIPHTRRRLWSPHVRPGGFLSSTTFPSIGDAGPAY